MSCLPACRPRFLCGAATRPGGAHQERGADQDMAPNQKNDGNRTPGHETEASVARDVRVLARHLAARLSADPTEAELSELATVVAEAYPQGGRALAKHVERNLRGRDPVLVARVREAAKMLLAMGERRGPSSSDQYCGARSAAQALGIPTSLVRRMLRRRDGRHSLGWPMHLGSGSFRIPRAAIDPVTRSQFFTNLGRDEPPHPEPLPAGYEQ